MNRYFPEVQNWTSEYMKTSINLWPLGKCKLKQQIPSYSRKNGYHQEIKQMLAGHGEWKEPFYTWECNLESSL